MGGSTAPSTPDRAGLAPPGTASGLPVWLHDRVLEVASDSWRSAAELADAAGLDLIAHDDGELHQLLELELTAPLRLEDWPAPTRPRAVNGGWIHDEVVDEDRQAFERLLPTWVEQGPEVVARSAQELRWPVTPYRRRQPNPIHAPIGAPIDPGRGSRPARSSTSGRRRPVVLDLTSHWAGPLATALLARGGAEVIKVDPDVRPDGFRGRTELYRHLNGDKRIIDLDLRQPADRADFDHLLARADLLVESFSRRVLTNLGYDRAALARSHPGLRVLALRAFPAGSSEAGWLAYGPGVHATSGLGLLGDEPLAAAVAYPDLTAGVAAFARATALLATDAAPGPSEVTLAGSIAPLIASVGGEQARGHEGANHG